MNAACREFRMSDCACLTASAVRDCGCWIVNVGYRLYWMHSADFETRNLKPEISTLHQNSGWFNSKFICYDKELNS